MRHHVLVAPRPAIAAAPSLPRLGDRFIGWLGWLLLGYALLGRGFAYVGLPPLFVGEISLLFGLVALTQSRSLPWALRLPPMRILLVFMLWSAACTVPYLSRYGVLALRDAVLWGYGLFAIITVSLLLDRPARLKTLFLRYRTFVVAFLCLGWALFMFKRLGVLRLPAWPGSGIPMGIGKGGDVMVHLAGVTAFLLLGMIRRNPLLYVLVGIVFMMAATINRGGMVAFTLAMLVLVVLKPPRARLGGLATGLSLCLLIAALVAPSLTVKKRTISVEQLWVNATSIVVDDGSHLSGTKNWRLDWWGRIVEYTFTGPYFLTGKGYGVNLTEADGILRAKAMKADREKAPLRSPHNGHVTVLARSGVPGFLLWIVLHLAWLKMVLGGWLRAKRSGDQAWQGVFAFLVAYWSAFMANAAFDVFLEGPMGGIWFWCLFGVGIAAAAIHERRPELLRR